MPSKLTPAEIQSYKEHANQSLQPNMVAMNVLGIILPYIAVALRFIARRSSVARIGSDDWFIFAALFPGTGFSISSFLMVHFGGGKHIIFVKHPQSYIETYISTITSYSVCVILTKISILLFYNRIFPSKALRHVSWGIGVVVVAYNVALILVTALECIPLSTLWDQKPGRCIDTLPPFTVLAVTNVATDIIILALPIKFVLRLRMRTMRKVQVCGVFLLGGLVCVFGLIRTVEVGEAPSTDQSYTAVYSGLWSYAEITVGIICACLPTYAILFSKSILHPSKGSSRWGIISNIWSNWSRSSNKSRSKIDEHPLQDWPSSQRIKISFDVDASTSKDGSSQAHILSQGFGKWSNSASAKGPVDEGEERPFVKLADSEAIYHGTSFTVASEEAKPSQDV